MATDRSEAAGTVVGALDNVEQGHRVAGWARIPGGGGEPVDVEILVDGALIATVTANQYRDDLSANGWGDCAFWCELPPDLLDGDEHLIGARFAATAAPLGNAPRLFSLKPGDPAVPASVLRGALDGIEDGGWAAGWAHAACNTKPQTVDIWIDGALIGAVVADQFRDDLDRDGSGDCAFWFGIPEALLDGREHEIDARYAGTNRSLHGSPQTFWIHAANALLTDGVNLIPTAAFDFWPNGLCVQPRERFEEIVSGWYYDFRGDRPPIVTIAADRDHDADLPRHAYAMRITVEEGGTGGDIRLIVPIATSLCDLAHYRFTIGLSRPPSADDDRLHVAEIFIGTVRGLAVEPLTTVHRALTPNGVYTLSVPPAVDDPASLPDVDPNATLALVIDLRGDGALSIFSPALIPA
ncbi:hypothetical protein M0208_17870 [Sphingomonas sp. SUN019]|uniref:hypothetical protein n=1 Tax=Sphingomonas sp. SUN019 TaxID=2937788 RepID=UPI002164D373|nr:hypothetical protein [Sphingomonas sp. SUN019]UVO52287.1 hypothetical protein M0208_17870 [Sphingomonas sp. SUN019]